MVFSSATFIFIFFPLVFLLIFLVRKTAIQNAVLILFSLLFYAWGEPVYVLLMILSVTINYLFTLPVLWMEKYKNPDAVRRLFIAIAVVLNVSLLMIFKYTDFIISSVNGVFDLQLRKTNIPLPIGISFFTFQAMSYVIDVWQGRANVQKNYFKVMLFISLFPALIAGPILKFRDIETQLTSRHITVQGVSEGARRFIFGLAKKVLIANSLGIVADQVFSANSSELVFPVVWIGALAYVVQIYFDFSGYSDMALGMGRMAGFTFKENFNYPYISSSVREFWRRWHISLTNWFKDYVYIPLGGNRKGKVRTGINKLIVFFTTGLWHGAQWTFVVWGLFHGLFMMAESYGWIKPDRFKWRWMRHLYVLLVVVIGFVLFRAPDFGVAATMISHMFMPFEMSPEVYKLLAGIISPSIIVAFLISIPASMPIKGRIEESLRTKGRIEESLGTKGRIEESIGAKGKAEESLDTKGRIEESIEKKGRGAQGLAQGGSYILALALFILCMLSISTSTYNPFIYFRF